MFAVLRHMGFGEQLLHWISSVYSSPRAAVKANGVFSEPFPIFNGTRQGWPLSRSLAEAKMLSEASLAAEHSIPLKVVQQV